MESWKCLMIFLLSFSALRNTTSARDDTLLRRFHGSGRPHYGGATDEYVTNFGGEQLYGGASDDVEEFGARGYGRGRPVYGGDSVDDFGRHGQPLYGGAAVHDIEFGSGGRDQPLYGGVTVDDTEFGYHSRGYRQPWYRGATVDDTEFEFDSRGHGRPIYGGGGAIDDANLGHRGRGKPGRQVGTADVRGFGAVGDGKTDDTKAFLAAWKAVCTKGSDGAKMIIPSGKVFLLSEVEFKGPCNGGLTVEILGTIVAPAKSEWDDKDADEWIKFHAVDDLKVVGNNQGLIDGQGESWWENPNENARPTALRFSRCNNLQLGALKHTNSPRNHISLTNCTYVMVSDLHITAPKKSPNTDGFDISHSKHITITDCIVATGDDCVAINNGTSNVLVTKMFCGPGHGISIGSLGKDGGHDEVEGITVDNCTLDRTDNGVRIKTWQGGSGFARNIVFSDIKFNAAQNPVIIDQFYCPHKTCQTQKSAVEVSGVRYTGLRGTWAGGNATIRFECSKTVPCTGIIVNNVDIVSADPDEKPFSVCVNVEGTVYHSPSPHIACLRNDVDA